MWQVEEQELRDDSKWDVEERASMEYTSLLINAQTGALIDKFAIGKGCGDYPGFISWEEAGGELPQ